MIEYLKAIYEIVVSNNKFLIALEKRIMDIEKATVVELSLPANPEAENKEVGDNNINEI